MRDKDITASNAVNSQHQSEGKHHIQQGRHRIAHLVPYILSVERRNLISGDDV